MKKQLSLIFLICALSATLATGCASSGLAQTNTGSAVTQATSTVQATTSTQAVESTPVSSSQDSAEATFDESDEATEISVESQDIDLSSYEANSVITIDTAGEYTLSGTLADGQVIVNVGDEEKVQLYLNNASITNDSGSAILVQNAEKVIITLIEGTVNTVTDGANYTGLDESGEPDAAIFAHDDLTINGDGSLTVVANYAEGIESRDDLKVSGGNITITAVGAGLFGNNSVEVKNDVVLAITSGADAIHSDGDILIESGTLTLNSGDDGIHADGTLTVNAGTINIQQCYEGLEATDVIVNGGTIDIVSSDDGINGAGGNDTATSDTTTGGRQDRFSSSQGSITINGGTITIAAGTSGNGDGLDANGALTITGGDTVIKTPSSYRDYTDVDYDSSFSLTGGSVRILNVDGSYTQVTESNVGNNMGGPGGRH